MPRDRQPSFVSCRCVSLHTYDAYVTADSWDVVIHVCACGREHINDSLPVRTLAAERTTSVPRRRVARRR